MRTKEVQESRVTSQIEELDEEDADTLFVGLDSIKEDK